MFLTLLRLQHPLVYRYAWLRVWVVVLRKCGLRKNKTHKSNEACRWQACLDLHPEVAWWNQR